VNAALAADSCSHTAMNARTAPLAAKFTGGCQKSAAGGRHDTANNNKIYSRRRRRRVRLASDYVD